MGEVIAPQMFTTGKDDWRTPPELFAALNSEFGFTLDVAATAANSLCADYCIDGLVDTWSGVCWCNPPYSRGRQSKFIAKAAHEQARGVTTVLLIPARTDTKAFHRWIWDAQRHQAREGVEIRFLAGRIVFVGAKHGAPFPSMVVVFRGKA